MADREYIRPPRREDFPGITEAAWVYIQQIAEHINQIKTQLNVNEYVDNAAAVTAGHATDDIYYNTTSSTFTKVT